MMDVKEWDERYARIGAGVVGRPQPVRGIDRQRPAARANDRPGGWGGPATQSGSRENGWAATAVDFSAVALAKAEEMAAERGVEITTVAVDLVEYEPEAGSYDLVLIAYLQIGAEERALVLERAAAAVAPGGRLLVVGHDVTNIEHGYGGPSDPRVLNSPEEVVAGLGEEFVISRAEVADRLVTTDEGERGGQGHRRPRPENRHRHLSPPRPGRADPGLSEQRRRRTGSTWPFASHPARCQPKPPPRREPRARGSSSRCGTHGRR